MLPTYSAPKLHDEKQQREALQAISRRRSQPARNSSTTATAFSVGVSTTDRGTPYLIIALAGAARARTLRSGLGAALLRLEHAA